MRVTINKLDLSLSCVVNLSEPKLVKSHLRTMHMPCCYRQRRKAFDTSLILDETAVDFNSAKVLG